VGAQRLDGEGWQGEDGVAGRGLERPDGQLSAPAVDVAITVAGVGEDGGVDDGQGLVEPDGAGVQVQVGPFQAAQLAVAGPGCRCQTWPACLTNSGTRQGVGRNKAPEQGGQAPHPIWVETVADRGAAAAARHHPTLP
jgi:hypothetical protein